MRREPIALPVRIEESEDQEWMMVVDATGRQLDSDEIVDLLNAQATGLSIVITRRASKCHVFAAYAKDEAQARDLALAKRPGWTVGRVIQHTGPKIVRIAPGWPDEEGHENDLAHKTRSWDQETNHTGERRGKQTRSGGSSEHSPDGHLSGDDVQPIGPAGVAPGLSTNRLDGATRSSIERRLIAALRVASLHLHHDDEHVREIDELLAQVETPLSASASSTRALKRYSLHGGGALKVNAVEDPSGAWVQFDDLSCAHANEAFNAAINFALDDLDYDGCKTFLDLWREGSWEEIAESFPEFKGPLPSTTPSASASSTASQEPKAFALPDLEGQTPCTDNLVGNVIGRLLVVDPAYKYAQTLIEHAEALERLFWRERKSSHGLMTLLAKARAERDGAPFAIRPLSTVPLMKRLKGQRDTVVELLRRVMICDRNANILNGARDLREDMAKALAEIPSYEQQLRNIADGIGMKYEDLIAAFSGPDIEAANKHHNDEPPCFGGSAESGQSAIRESK